MPTEWGTHSLVRAVRLMVAEALQDPTNQRFMLMSGELHRLYVFKGLGTLRVFEECSRTLHGCLDCPHRPRLPHQLTNIRLPQPTNQMVAPPLPASCCCCCCRERHPAVAPRPDIPAAHG